VLESVTHDRTSSVLCPGSDARLRVIDI